LVLVTLVTISRYVPGAIAFGSAATMRVSVEESTWRSVPARLTRGVPEPKLSPKMVSIVSASLAVVFSICGAPKWLSA
jgi:hypothetical protein